ncbi:MULTISPECIES: cytochrome b/b6 domain-containing protein [unclassified Marinovum]
MDQTAPQIAAQDSQTSGGIRVWGRMVRLLHATMVLSYGAGVFVYAPGSTGHVVAGGVLAVALALRVIWGLMGPYDAALSKLRPCWTDMRDQIKDLWTGEKRFDIGLSPLGVALAVNLLATMAGVAISGVALGLLAASGDGLLADLHEALVLWANLSIAAHVAAVIWSSLKTGVNLLWAMVSGVKPLPDAVYWRDERNPVSAPVASGLGDPRPDPERDVFRR